MIFLVVLIPKRNGISFGANSYKIVLHFGTPSTHTLVKENIHVLMELTMKTISVHFAVLFDNYPDQLKVETLINNCKL